MPDAIRAARDILKGKPENIQIIQVRGDEPVQWRHFEQNKYLYKNEQHKPEYIFQQLAHWNFFRVESSRRFCSMNWVLAITYTYSILKKFVAGFTFSV